MAPARSRRPLLLLALLTLSLMVPAAAAGGSGPPRVVVNGQALSLDVAPSTESNRLLVPMRAIFEALGASLTWDGATRSVLAARGGLRMRLTIDSPTARVGDRPVTLDPPPRLVNGRTMVPLRFVAESLGAQVGWDAATQTASIRFGEAGVGENAAALENAAAAPDAPLTMDLPAGWQQVITDDGAVLVGPDPARTAPVVVVWPLVGGLGACPKS